MECNKLYIIPLVIVFAFAACSTPASDIAPLEEKAPMYPDYTDITVPVNIAPLNFLLREDVSKVAVLVDGKPFFSGRGNKVRFSERRWRALLERNVGGSLRVEVCARSHGRWKRYAPFVWKVTEDRLDPYLTYRLTEPDYEAFNNLVLQERNVENFDTRNFSDYSVIGNRCMNCHTFAGQDPDHTMFYVRGEGGGAILNTNGKLQKLGIKADGMVAGSTYFGFSPSKRHVVFSANKVIPAYNAHAGDRMEVFDIQSDVYVADLEKHTILENPLLSGSGALETFPCFSPDGKYIYFCTSQPLDTMTLDAVRKLMYSLCRIDFDEAAGRTGTQVDTVYNARIEGHSVCHPRISPDGKFVCFTIADYGTFPLWHDESDLVLLEIATGRIIPMDLANSDKCDTYHSWSSNSRWIVVASKRDDGQYGKPYFTHIDSEGNCSKAFVLPQKHPDFYDNFLKSFNTIESGTGPLPFDTYDVKAALEQPSQPFALVK